VLNKFGQSNVHGKYGEELVERVSARGVERSSADPMPASKVCMLHKTTEKDTQQIHPKFILVKRTEGSISSKSCCARPEGISGRDRS
jgi:hypothetical protein